MRNEIDHAVVSDPVKASVAVLVMGVAGCGKSSVARAIADALGGMLIEGDSFHPQGNIRKMRQGIALTDLDRAAWLASLNQAAHSAIDSGLLPILACSALKQCYRDILENGIRSVLTVFLRLPESVAKARVSSRPDHYMPATLVASQFADLEPPEAGSNVICIDATLPLSEVLIQIESWWRRH